MEKEVVVVLLRTDLQVADILTKPLNKGKLEAHRTSMGVLPQLHTPE